MYIAIKYELRRSAYNKQLQSLGSAVLMYGKTHYYFTNPLVALRAANYLNNKNPQFKYSICKVPESFTKNKMKFSSYREFNDYANPQNTNENEK